MRFFVRLFPSNMYVLNDFRRSLLSFVRHHSAQDVDLKMPTDRQRVNGHVRFYSAKVSTIRFSTREIVSHKHLCQCGCSQFCLQRLQHLVNKLVDEFATIERCLYCPDYMSIWLKKELWTAAIVRQISDMGSLYGRSEQFKGIVMYTINLVFPKHFHIFLYLYVYFFVISLLKM